MNTAQKLVEAKLDLQPILDVFSGADGGAAFSRIRHAFIPEIYCKEQNTDLEKQFIQVVKQFSRFCQAALDNQI